jgi:hypothetical protein
MKLFTALLCCGTEFASAAAAAAAGDERALAARPVLLGGSMSGLGSDHCLCRYIQVQPEHATKG